MRMTGAWSSSRGRTTPRTAMRSLNLSRKETVRYFSDRPGVSTIECGPGRQGTGSDFSFCVSFPLGLMKVFRRRLEARFTPKIVDRLRAQGAIQRAEGYFGARHPFWDLGSPLNTVTWFFQILGAEIRVIDCDSDLDLTPVQRVARMLAKGYFYGSHFLPHDAQVTQRGGQAFLAQIINPGLGIFRPFAETHDMDMDLKTPRAFPSLFFVSTPVSEGGKDSPSIYPMRPTSSTLAVVEEPDYGRAATQMMRGRCWRQM